MSHSRYCYLHFQVSVSNLAALSTPLVDTPPVPVSSSVIGTTHLWEAAPPTTAPVVTTMAGLPVTTSTTTRPLSFARPVTAAPRRATRPLRPVTAVSSQVARESGVVYTMSPAVLPTVLTSSRDVFFGVPENPLLPGMRASHTQALATMRSAPIMSTWASPTLVASDALDSLLWRPGPPVPPLPAPVLDPPALVPSTRVSQATPTIRLVPPADTSAAGSGTLAVTTLTECAVGTVALRSSPGVAKKSSRRTSRRPVRRVPRPASPQSLVAPSRAHRESSLDTAHSQRESALQGSSDSPGSPRVSAPVALVVGALAAPDTRPGFGPVLSAAPVAVPASSLSLAPSPVPILPYTSGLTSADLSTNLPPAERLFDEGEAPSSPPPVTLMSSWASSAGRSSSPVEQLSGSLKRGAASSDEPTPNTKRTRTALSSPACPSSGLSQAGSYEQPSAVSARSFASSTFLADLSDLLPMMRPASTPPEQLFDCSETPLSTPPPLDLASPRPISPMAGLAPLPAAERAFLRDLLDFYNNCRDFFQRWPQAPDLRKWL